MALAHAAALPPEASIQSASAQAASAPPGLPAIRLRNVTIAYRRHPAVHHVSGTFLQGSLTALIGPNGAGKSSLLKAMVGLLPLSGGEIEIVDRAGLAFLPQVTEVDRSFPITVAEVVDLGHWSRIGAMKHLGRKAREKSLSAIASVGLAGFAERPISSLSVGQFQRVLFARLIATDARLILLDEPFNAIDQRTIEELMRLIERWRDEGRTIVAALHDFDLVRRHFEQALLLAREPIAWGPTAAVLAEPNLARARVLADGWREAAPVCEI